MNMSNELYHFGIKGMKWGVRRFQNPDGTYTLAGKKRYGIGQASSKAENLKAKARSWYQKNKTVVNRIAAIGAEAMAANAGKRYLERKYGDRVVSVGRKIDAKLNSNGAIAKLNEKGREYASYRFTGGPAGGAYYISNEVGRAIGGKAVGPFLGVMGGEFAKDYYLANKRRKTRKWE